MLQPVVWLVILASSVGIAFDASRLGARRGALGGGLLDMGPAGWFFSCLFLWIIALPCYLMARGRLIRRHDAIRLMQSGRLPAAGALASARTTSAARPGPPGWYADPLGRPQWRWWNGEHWTDDVH